MRIRNPWLPTLGSNPRARLRLFCVPYAGGNAAVFNRWSMIVPPEIEVCGVELPGRNARMSEPRITNLAVLVEQMMDALLAHCDLPFCFFGHSVGALISFELAHAAIRNCGVTPVHLFVAGHDAPHLPDRFPPRHVLLDDFLIEYLRSLHGSSESALSSPELMKIMLPIIRADLKLSETYYYRQRSPLSCPITAFGGLNDPETSSEGLAAWRFQTRSSFVLEMLSEGHFFLASLPGLLATPLSTLLSEGSPLLHQSVSTKHIATNRN